MNTQEWAKHAMAGTREYELGHGLRPQRALKINSSIIHHSPKALGQHNAWMLEQLLTMPSDEKSQRWVGFIQGVTFAMGQMSIDDLREFNQWVENVSSS